MFNGIAFRLRNSIRNNRLLFLGSLFFCLFCSLNVRSQTYTTPGRKTFTVPAGVTSITVECWGAGGSGGTRSSDGAGGGGGGGAYSLQVISVVPGTSYSYTVGAGAANTSSSAGGDSYFQNAAQTTTFVLAKGGNSVASNSATRATGGSASAGTGSIKYNGGDGKNGNTSGTDYGGGGGSSAGTGGSGTDATNVNGAVAPTDGGNGGDGRWSSEGNGSDGENPGGGGGGAIRNNGTDYGGNGADGQIRITYTVCVSSVAPTGAIASSTTICAGTQITLKQTGGTLGTGAKWYWYSGSCGGTLIGSSTSSDGSLTITPAASTTYYVRSEGGACSSTTLCKSVEVTVTPLPTTANAGTDQTGATTCGKTYVTLAANAPAVGTGKWNIVSGSGGSFSNILSRTATFSGTAGNSYTLRWTITNGTCTSTDDVDVTFNQASPTADAGPDQTVCGLTTATLAGNNPSSGTGVWTSTGGGSFSNASSPASTFTGTAGNSYNLKWTISNACGSSSDNVTVALNKKPVANDITGPSTVICTYDTIQLHSNATGTGLSYSWTSSNTAVATVDDNGIVTRISQGSANITYTITNGTCSATSSAYMVTVNPFPTGNFTASKSTICAGEAVTFTAPYSTDYGAYTFYVNGVQSQATSATDPTFHSSTLQDGDQVTVAVANSSNCGTTFGPVVMVVNPLPTAFLGSDKTVICAGENVTFTASGGTNYVFSVITSASTSIVQSGSSSTYTTNTLNDKDAVTVEVNNGVGSCSSANSPTIGITVNPLPNGTLTATTSTSVCFGENISFEATGGASYQFRVNGAIAQAWSSNSTFTSSDLPNGASVTVDVANGVNGSGCTTTYSGIVVTVNPLPQGTLTASSYDICQNLPVAFTFTGSTSYSSYNFLVNGDSKQNTASNVFTATGLATNDEVKVVVKSGSGCSATFTAPALTIEDIPTGTLTVPSDYVCTGDDVTFTATAGNGNNYKFKINNNTEYAGTLNTFTTSSLNEGDIVSVEVTNNKSCAVTFNSITMHVNAYPVVAPITGVSNICVNAQSDFTDNTPGGVWSVTNGTGTATIALTNGKGRLKGGTPGSVTVNYTLTNNGCSVTQSTAAVMVNPLPTPSLIGPDPICPGSIDTYTTEDGMQNYSWTYYGGSLQSGGSSTDNAISIKWDQPGTKGIYVNYSTPEGCSGSIIVSVKTNTGTIPTLSGNQSLCQNLTATYITNPGQSDYTWTIPPGNTIVSGGESTDNSVTIQWLSAGPKTVSINFADKNGCVAAEPTPLKITVNPLPTATISGTTTICQASAQPSITFTGTKGTAPFTFFYNINGAGSTQSVTTTSGNSVAVLAPTGTAGSFKYNLLSVSDSYGCSQPSSGSATVTVTPTPTATISYTGGPFCSTTGAVNVTFSGASTGGTYSATPSGLTINPGTGKITPSSSAAGIYTVTYTFAAANGCAQYTTSAPVTITAAPTAVAGADMNTCSNSGAVDITTGAIATNYSSVLWTSGGSGGTIANAGLLTGATYTPSQSDINAGFVILTLTANGNAGCGPAASTKKVTIIAPPDPFTLTPATATICLGEVVPMTATGTTPTTGSVTMSSGNINVRIPDAGRRDPGSVTTNLSVSTVPANAVISSMSVNFNIDHSRDHDLILNLKAPNGNVLNLVDQRGNTGKHGNSENFENTTVSSNSNNPFTDNKDPFTGTYTADAHDRIGTPQSDRNISFSDLFSQPNGTWTFGAEDEDKDEDGTINSWSITINYTIPIAPVYVTWSPVTDLFTDASLGTIYTGQTQSTVYAKPSTSGTKIYTATETNAAGCSTSKEVSILVNPIPVVTITPDYCKIPGRVLLTATSVPAATGGFIWSTGATTDTTSVDIAGYYDVTAFAGTGCAGKASISVAQELVTNGNFDKGDDGSFTSDYAYKPDVSGNNELVDDSGNNGYSVSTSGQNVHTNFWGKDHTTGEGNFMLVNGHGNTLVVWKETISVLPNTVYYFSAWAMGLNSVEGPANNAHLQFSVNGTLVGSTAVLDNHGESSNSPDNWNRFYGTWTSGPTTTTADIYIKDLQAALTGNDFGLDDISFGTLSTFIRLESPSGTDGQTVCLNNPLDTILYSVGSTASTPTIAGLPPGLKTSFNGIYFTITGSPTQTGTFAYTITTAGTCNVTSASGFIKVVSPEINLTSGNSSPTICVNTPVNIGFTMGGTATTATVSEIPSWLTFHVDPATKAVTLTGTPPAGTEPKSYPYTITVSGTCNPVTVSGAVLVQAQTVESPAKDQTVCINSQMTNIQYTVGGTSTNATITGLPNGVTGKYNGGGIFVISGTPTQTGSFTYTITTSGTCEPVNTTGTITVTPTATISLTSAPGPQIVCINSPITITYQIKDATSASVSGLPAEMSYNYNSGTGLLTITGSPATSSAINYIVTSSGGCGVASIPGTITVNMQKIDLTSGTRSPSVCSNSPLPSAIVYTFSGSATGATVSGLPGGLSAVISGHTVTISGTPITAGISTYIITTSGTCAPATTSGTITVIAAAAIITPPQITALCPQPFDVLSTTFSVTASSATTYKWQVSTDDGTTWTNITANATYSNVTTHTLQISGITETMEGYQYHCIVTNASSCAAATSVPATLFMRNIWKGTTSTDWATPSNWWGNIVPDINCEYVIVPKVSSNLYPILTGSETEEVRNIVIRKDASVTIKEAATLQVRGAIYSDMTNSAFGYLDGTDGKIELNGGNNHTYTGTDTAQIIAGSLFKTRTLKDLQISNPINATVKPTANDTLNITGTLSFGPVNNATLNTGNNITLISTSAKTARVADITNNGANSGNNFNGDVVVERYINTGTGAGEHGKAWEFLAIPVTGQTVKAGWMENGSLKATGFGTQITGIGAGFDQYSAAPSMKYYNSGTDPQTTANWIGISSPSIESYNPHGYMLFVRGDRSIPGPWNDAISTRLRTKGKLFTYNVTLPVEASGFTSVGNPYASAIDMTKVIAQSPGVDPFYTIWTSPANGTYGYGSYSTYSTYGAHFEATPGGAVTDDIQSGQAFFVHATGGAGKNIIFNERSKSDGSSSAMFRLGAVSPQMTRLRTNLYGINGGSTYLADGTLHEFSDDFNPRVDGNDALKILNSADNFDISSNGKKLIIERTKIPTEKDTLFFDLTGVSKQAYRFEFVAKGWVHAGVDAFLEDSYLRTRTPILPEDTTIVNFKVDNNKGSYAANRFFITFKNSTVTVPEALPMLVTFNATGKEHSATITWKVQNEQNLLRYEVERSTNGALFTSQYAFPAFNSGDRNYLWNDSGLLPATYYYRLKSVDHKGKISYSEQVKVQIGDGKRTITIYPNPIVNGIIHLQFINQPAGKYGIRLMNQLGQVIVAKQVERMNGSNTETLTWDYNLSHGIYQLEITQPDGKLKVIKVIY